MGYRFSSNFCPPFNCTRSSTTPFLTPSSTTQEPTPSSCSSAETFDTLTAVGSTFKDSRHQSGVAFCLSNGNVSQFECSPVRCPLFAGAYPNASHPSSFSVRCDSNLCAFPSSLRCDLQGCVVQPAHISGGGHSTGGADHIRYEKNGQHIDPNEDVELLLGENVSAFICDEVR